MSGKGADAPACGVLLVDKPAGPTSHDVVDRARRALRTRRVGHTGTLDPFATGLLVLCVGPATRLAEYFHLPDKEYEAVLRLGVETETHDPEGDVVRESDGWRDVTPGELERTLEGFTGRIRQRPPDHSAKKVDGRRAHEAARAGDPLELEAEEVRVAHLSLEDFDPPEARVRARVSTGTYIRALARDVGRSLGCGAHLRSLRRTAVGPLRAEDAVPLRALDDAGGGSVRQLAAPARTLTWLPTRSLDDDEAERVAHGARIPRGAIRPPRTPLTAEEASGGGPRDRPVLLLHGDRLLAVAEPAGRELQPRKVRSDAA